MKNTRSSRLILNEMERLESLSGRELQNYISELRDALYHERKAMNVREFRLREKLNEVTKAVTETVTQQKEEKSEKENLPPTPPIKEKGKKEEMPPAAATRASLRKWHAISSQRWPNSTANSTSSPIRTMRPSVNAPTAFRWNWQAARYRSSIASESSSTPRTEPRPSGNSTGSSITPNRKTGR